MTNNTRPKLLIILGPTACRKTYFSLQMAERHNAEIIAADSMQIYKHLDIGTAKPTLAQRKQIPHHMIDIINPDEYFSAKDFEERADTIIGDISRREKKSIVVGGTGFFIKALTGGLFDLKDEHNSLIRKKLENEETQKLYEALIESTYTKQNDHLSRSSTGTIPKTQAASRARDEPVSPLHSQANRRAARAETHREHRSSNNYSA